jgi:diaminohydroxyphosphoribosylaminopyrimidine deaminase/5-amino-6-(5-phosphoribosylamino)uracil reductase
MMKGKKDEKFMRLALKEAKKGVGRTSPNPAVGAVIVRDGKVISKGYHKKAGSPHAEINAIRNAKESILGATIYVTLEPCNHTGKTPPCTEAIIRKGIDRVVVGMKDPNPLVAGSGINRLLEKGLAVDTGILEKECRDINLSFIKYISQGMPWMIMKAGVSLDGRINYQKGQAGWITGKKSVTQVHRLRDKVDAILVGRGTVVIDNPSLTTRLSHKTTQDPVRIIVDTELSAPLFSKIFHLDSQAPTWVFCADDVCGARRATYENVGVKVLPVQRGENGLDLKKIIVTLGKKGICSVLVEGGGRLHSAFLREELYDFAYIFHAPLFAGDRGISLLEEFSVKERSGSPYLSEVSYKRLGDDMMVSGRMEYRQP